MRAAVDLAEVGCRVTLVDASPATGGVLTKLDQQFPNNHCGMCRILPEVGQTQSARFCLRKGLQHDAVEVLVDTRVAGVTGEPGSFQVTLVRQPQPIDHSRCANCSRPCLDACPVTVPDPFEHGLTRRKAVYQPLPQSLPDTLHVDWANCTRCGACVQACPQQAIDLDAPEESITREADAIVLSTGTRICDSKTDPAVEPLQVSEDVVTALCFERMLSRAGPRREALSRPSDGKPVERVAWLQCVGSRDRKHGRDTCSTVCCMFALKEARLVREIGNGAIEATIFYMDLRGQGRAFHRNRVQAEACGVRLVRSRLQDVAPAADGGVRVRYMDPDSGKNKRERFDLLVLSTGQTPSPQAQELGRLLGWESTEAGYAPSCAVDRTRSPVPGVFLAGSVTGPTDIAESIVSATAACGEVSRLLVSLGREVGTARAVPTRKKPRGDESRVLGLVCRCHHGTTPSPHDLETLAATCGGEVHTVESPCLSEGAQQVRRILAQTEHDRTVFAACDTHVYRRDLLRMAEGAGFDPALVRVVDARGGMLPVRMAATALRSIDTSEASTLAARTRPARVLVVGGGLAGMHAALALSQHDVEVHLVERADKLGGRFARHPGSAPDGTDLSAHVEELCRRVAQNDRIKVHTGAEAVVSTEMPGRRETIVRRRAQGDVLIAHGATILATGGHEAVSRSYGYGQSERVLDQTELEELLARGPNPSLLGTVVMIQCVGAREPGAHPYCSRICCPRALRNAERIRQIRPDARIAVLYRDMMATGDWEHVYTRARRQGTLFVPYDVAHKPNVEVVQGRPRISVRDPVLGRELRFDADWLVLSTAVEPDGSSARLARMFGASTDEDGFLIEADAKWRPVDAARDGVYVAGSARMPEPAREVVAEAEAAAQRALAHLTRSASSSVGAVARVHDSMCSRCGLCVQACPYGARMLWEEEDRVVVDAAACRGCGLCTSACPNSATRLGAMGDRQVMETLDVALENVRLGPPAREGMS